MMEERMEIGYGRYRCIRCGSDMVVVRITDADGRFVYREEPIACPRCNDFMEAVINLAETINPELVDRLKRFFF
jgi:DNA-directed RNA polymerase subunit RPC12/RpoP